MKALIDSIDGASARVLMGDDAVAVLIPLSQLPPRVKEGLVLHVRFTVDQAASNAKNPSRARSAELE